MRECTIRTASLPPNCGSCVLDESSAIFGEDGRCFGAEFARATGECRDFCDSLETPIPIEARCGLLCDASDQTSCTADDAAACVSECVPRAQALPPTCATCVFDRSSSLFGEDSRCFGAEFARATRECREFCGAIENPIPFRARCEQLCDVSDDPPCSSDDEDTCLNECTSRVEPLAPGCATCVLDSSNSILGEGDSCFGAEFARVTECADFCG